MVATATAAATLAYAPAEPYAAIITVLLPPVFVLAWSGLRGGSRSRRAGASDREMDGAGRPSSASVCSSVWRRCSTRCCSAYAAFTLALMALVVDGGPQELGPAAAAGRHRVDRRASSR